MGKGNRESDGEICWKEQVEDDGDEEWKGQRRRSKAEEKREFSPASHETLIQARPGQTAGACPMVLEVSEGGTQQADTHMLPGTLPVPEYCEPDSGLMIAFPS